ncbi:MAG TPA: hypothetical protein DD412_02500 [Holosporales bacterium]|nr:hypothetical protein [Holosporales bacterium]
MKNTFKLALLTITLSAFTAQSCEYDSEEQLIKETPKMITNTMEGISKENQAAELKFLNRGMVAFSAGKFFNALNHFQKALGDYGSPLGYFYASFLETDRETKLRYLHIARNAENYGALPKGTLYDHNTWVKGIFEAKAEKAK